jgi:hypothetical protein
MNWVNRLFSKRPTSSKSSDDDPDAFWLYVQCGRCRTPLAIRVDRRNELNRDYETGDMVLKKEMMDNVCFQLMKAEVHLDDQGKVKSEDVDKGRFLTREEYELLRSSKA